MRFARWFVVAIAVGFGGASVATAGSQEAWEDVQSVHELPAGVQALLGVGLGGEGIADRGGSFNTSDVVVDNTPQRRFVLGIENGDTVVVGVEQGGRGYSVQVLEFHQDGTAWVPARCVARRDVPRTGMELLGTFATRPPAAESSCQMAGDHVTAAPERAPVLQLPVRPQPAS